jgi:hypothetical protein
MLSTLCQQALSLLSARPGDPVRKASQVREIRPRSQGVGSAESPAAYTAGDVPRGCDCLHRDTGSRTSAHDSSILYATVSSRPGAGAVADLCINPAPAISEAQQMLGHRIGDNGNRGRSAHAHRLEALGT